MARLAARMRLITVVHMQQRPLTINNIRSSSSSSSSRSSGGGGSSGSSSSSSS